jgi:very-short-patch-repair endonuclease
MAAQKGFKKVCEKCKQKIGVYGFKKHYEKCNGEGLKVWKRASHCKVCGQSYESFTRIQKKVHTSKCKGIQVWNKGKTKEIDPRIAAHALQQSKTQKGKPGRPHSTETKAKLSKIALRRHAEGTMPHYTRKERSTAELYFDYIVKDVLKDASCVFEFRIGRYHADYAWLDKMKILEVDGCQHYTPEGLMYDSVRDAKIRSKGWEILRFKWSEVMKNKPLYIQKLKDYLQA